MEFQIVTDPQLLDRVYAFRYDIIYEKPATRKYVEGNEDKRDIDEYDAYSVHFAACDESGEVMACVRLIHHSPVGLPTLNNMEHACLPHICDPEHLGEFSRIFVSPKVRGIRHIRPMFDTLKLIVYTTMKELGITDTVGSLEPPFFRLLHMLGFPYTRIGELQEYVGMRYPSRLVTDELYTENLELFRKHGIAR